MSSKTLHYYWGCLEFVSAARSPAWTGLQDFFSSSAPIRDLAPWSDAEFAAEAGQMKTVAYWGDLSDWRPAEKLRTLLAFCQNARVFATYGAVRVRVDELVAVAAESQVAALLVVGGSMPGIEPLLEWQRLQRLSLNWLQPPVTAEQLHSLCSMPLQELALRGHRLGTRDGMLAATCAAVAAGRAKEIELLDNHFSFTAIAQVRAAAGIGRKVVLDGSEADAQHNRRVEEAQQWLAWRLAAQRRGRWLPAELCELVWSEFFL